MVVADSAGGGVTIEAATGSVSVVVVVDPAGVTDPVASIVFEGGVGAGGGTVGRLRSATAFDPLDATVVGVGALVSGTDTDVGIVPAVAGGTSSVETGKLAGG